MFKLKKGIKKLALATLACVAGLGGASAADFSEWAKKSELNALLIYKMLLINEGDKNDNHKLSDHGWQGLYTNGSNQAQYFSVYLAFRQAIDDNFSFFVSSINSASSITYGKNARTNPLSVGTIKQILLTYNNADAHTKIEAGRQFLGTMWTYPTYPGVPGYNAYGSMAGTGIKITNTSLEKTTLLAFAFDSVSWKDLGLTCYANGICPDEGVPLNGQIGSWLMTQNFYGAAVQNVASLAGGSLTSQLWLGYLEDRATLYTLSEIWTINFWEGWRYQLTAAYFGNALAAYPKRQGWGNGNFFKLAGALRVGDWDFALGGLHYGRRDKKSFAVLEDQGAISLPTYYIFYVNGSNINGDLGENNFAYATASYIITRGLRLSVGATLGATNVDPGVKYTTKVLSGSNFTDKELPVKGRKNAYSLSLSYSYSSRLSFSAYYTYLQLTKKHDYFNQNFGYIQAVYRF